MVEFRKCFTYNYLAKRRSACLVICFINLVGGGGGGGGDHKI